MCYLRNYIVKSSPVNKTKGHLGNKEKLKGILELFCFLLYLISNHINKSEITMHNLV